MGDVKAGSRKRAVGTRDRVISHLGAVGEVRDPGGMASTALAEAVGYPGTSVAFAQLLSGMERAALIEREIRGKRTYRIALAGPEAAGRAAGQAAQRKPARQAPVLPDAVPAAAGDAGAGLLAGAGGAAGFDYDELARRLLVQVVQRVAAEPGHGAGRAAEPGPAPEDDALARTVASLEQKLASIRSRQRKLTAENAKLREQLRAAQQSLAEAQERAGAGPGGQLDTAEVRLLERLLNPLRAAEGRQEEAGAS